MIYLFASIACSTIIVLIFKYFERFHVNSFQAIVVNYFTCVAVGWPLTDMQSLQTDITQIPWLPFALFLGLLFITIFSLVGITAQKVGITVASVSMKLSLAVPLVLAFLIYNESFSWLKLTGAILALVAVVLTSLRNDSTNARLNEVGAHPWLFALPFIVFFGSGIADAVVQYTEIKYFENGGFEAFVIVLFGTAAFLGLLIAIWRVVIGKDQLSWRNVIGGILLGIPNYGSIYFFYATLVNTGWESSVVFPVNNIGIVSVTTLAAVVLFKEKLNTVNLLGLACAILSILMIGIAEYNGSISNN